MHYLTIWILMMWNVPNTATGHAHYDVAFLTEWECLQKADTLPPDIGRNCLPIRVPQ